MTPFTAAEFFAVFRAYNLAVWPAQIVLIAGAVAAVGLAQARTRPGRSAAGFLLAAMWLWMGAVYHLMFFASINPAAYVFGALFILQGGLFAHAAWRGQLTFTRRGGASEAAGWVLVLYALVVYPAIGLLTGRASPDGPTFGAPCPTAIFTLGLLLWADRPVPIRLLLVPLAWSLLGASAAWSFGMLEDVGLTLAGILTALLIVRGNRRTTRALAP